MQSSSPPRGATGDLVPPWLRALPLAPEFHPTEAEFADPVAYILKIEPAAAPYGICKVVPPCAQPPRKTTLANLARSFAALRSSSPNDATPPSFPARHQYVGLYARRALPAVQAAWLSARRYTLQQFEARAAAARRPLLARLGVPASRHAHLSPLDHDALFWRAAAADRPVTVDYASDMPGSGFSAPSPAAAAARQVHRPAHVGDTAWNMRAAARSPGSLLRFARDEVPGVTTPMLYVGMLFSWFAWHVEDHDLHSINYLHFGAAKTWYGVPRDAALAFEDVVRVHGYGGEVNPLETFETLGKKTTVMSPEVFVGSGVPCCRLVQNAGEFVVTFPGSYHSGFSHGFNCGEASNIATPEWLTVAKEAAIRRASINRPPMLSHYQLLYELAVSMCIRDPSTGAMEPRSSRLKEKKKGEGGQLVKKLFVQNVIQDNELLSCLLNDGSSCIILPINAHDGPVLSALRSRYQLKPKSNLSDDLCSSGKTLEASRCLPLNEAFDREGEIRNCGALSSSKERSLPACSGKKYPPERYMHDSVNLSSSSDTYSAEGDEADIISAAGLLDQGLLSCVSCGILSFSCVAVIKPRECASNYFMSSDYNLINDQLVGPGGSHLANATGIEGTNGGILRPCFEPYGNEILSDAEPVNKNSALGSNEDIHNKKLKVSHESMELSGQMTEPQHNGSSNICFDETKISSSSDKCQQRPSSQSFQCIGGSGISNGPRGVRTRNKYKLKLALSEGFQLRDNRLTMEQKVLPEPSSSEKILKEEPLDASGTDYDGRCNSTAIVMDDPRSSAATVNNLNKSIVKFDKDSSRMHVFCLEHAVEVEKQLRAIGGAKVILLCRPEYLKIEAEARSLAAEMEVEYDWKDIHFREAKMEDRQMIQELLQDEESIPTNSDWAVKLGTNLYYSANLAKSPSHNKEIPYNRVIYKAFGYNSPSNSPEELNNCERSQGRQKKIVIAGRWCGKVWMSDQVHPILAQRTEGNEMEVTDVSSGVEASRRNSRILAQRTEGSEMEETDDSSGVEASRRKSSTATAVLKSSKKRVNVKLEETSTKRPKLTEDFCSKAFKGVAEVSSSPTGAVHRASSKIAKRTNRVKLEMTEEDDDPASCPKSKATSHHSRTRPPEKTEVEVKKEMKISRGDKTTALTVPKDEEEHPHAANGSPVSSDTKWDFYPRKHRTRTEAKIQLKKVTAAEMKMSARDPLHVKEYTCSIEGCSTIFDTRNELSLHERDICPVKSCGKKFVTHKYLLQHGKVHTDHRPLKCPWEGCGMAFKWSWARTEHLRVHTGDRPYACLEPECAQTFRFVSDFSRHKRSTGHSPKGQRTKA
uniref:Uncharacterized protein n=1 Tax=Avena sativa TaxID=4498 RepID=A0ACD5XD13_AVESA